MCVLLSINASVFVLMWNNFLLLYLRKFIGKSKTNLE